MAMANAGRTVAAALFLISLAESAPSEKVFRAGAYAMDVSPAKLPVVVSGMFLTRTADLVTDPVYARSLVLDDGETRLALVVVDSCMMPRELLDRAKEMASRKTGIPPARMLISATHTHSAPSAMGVLGSPADGDYAALLPGRIAEGIEQAARRVAPARIGWAAVADYEHTYCRRWIYRPDKMPSDPFGSRTVRANMHPGYQNPDAIGPSGPVDPGLTVVSIQSPEGRPMALLANYSMHYFGSKPVSADYFGLFAAKIAQRIGADGQFVAMMSQGTSGDQMWMDYGQPKSGITLDAYAEEVTSYAGKAYQKIEYRDWAPLAMAETTLSLRRRTPDPQRLAWAREITAPMAGRLPKNQQEVYAAEQIYLHEEPVRELKLQAIRIGDLGITAIPNEVYAISGLKLKAQSPAAATFNIELANGAEGYVPPPEQHKLGGYTTWPARTAALEVEAEPRIVETLTTLLERVFDKQRYRPAEALGPYAQAVLTSKPAAYWRFSEFNGPLARDSSGRERHGTYEDGVAFYLPGPHLPGERSNPAAHFAGGRVAASLDETPDNYSVEMWFWNGLPSDARGVTGYLFSRGEADALGIGGTDAGAGKLIFAGGLEGKTEIQPKTWNHVVMARQGRQVRVYLNGAESPDIAGEVPGAPLHRHGRVFVGGRQDGFANFEGKIDEVALYDRALTQADAGEHFRAGH